MNRAPRVLMVINARPGRVSGSAKQARFLGQKLVERKVEVRYLVCNRESGRRGIWVRDCELDGCPAVEIPIFKRSWTMPYSAFLARRALREMGDRCDLVHIHGGNPFSIWFSAESRRRGLRTLMKNTLVGEDSADAVRHRYGEKAFAAYGANDAIVCMTSAQRELALAEGIEPDRLHLIPNGVAVNRFVPTGQERRPGDPFRLLSVGYLMYRKGFDHLIRVLAGLGARGLDARLTIATNVGNLPPAVVGVYEELGRLMKELGVEDRVDLVEGDDVAARFREADAFVFASRGEGFGTVQIEAMASGIPSVACRLDGVNTDIYRDGEDGFLTPPEDVDAMVEKVALLIRDPGLCLRMGQAARARAETVFSLDAVADQYVNLYHRLLD